MKRHAMATCLLMAALGVCAQTQEQDSLRVINLQEVEVISTRATNSTPVAFTNIGKEQLKKQKKLTEAAEKAASDASVQAGEAAGLLQRCREELTEGLKAMQHSFCHKRKHKKYFEMNFLIMNYVYL